MKVHGTIQRGQNKGADEASVAVVEVDEVVELDGDERAGERARNPPGVCRPPTGAARLGYGFAPTCCTMGR